MLYVIRSVGHLRKLTLWLLIKFHVQISRINENLALRCGRVNLAIVFWCIQCRYVVLYRVNGANGNGYRIRGCMFWLRGKPDELNSYTVWLRQQNHSKLSSFKLLL